MDSKGFTFLVLCSKRGKIRQFRMAPSSILVLGIVVILSLVFGGFGLFTHINTKKDRKYLRDLRREARTHQDRIQAVATEMEELRQQLVRMQQTDKKIRIIANLPQSSSEVQVSGMGGVSTEEGIAQSLQRERKENWVRRIREQFDRLKGFADQQESSFAGLEEQLRDDPRYAELKSAELQKVVKD